MTLTSSLRAAEDVGGAAQRAVDHLLSLQDGAGYWKGELETNVTMDAEDLLLRQFLGVRAADASEQTARWIRSQQRDDGTWANFYGGPADLSTTIEAYVALRCAGDAASAPHMEKAAGYIRRAGGLPASRVFTRIWLALFDLWPWDELPSMPPEMIYLPKWAPLNIYDFSCWARQTVVALTIVGAFRPARPLGFDLGELQADGSAGAPAATRRSWHSRTGMLQGLDHVLHRYERHPLRPLRRAALRRAERWIVARQEADGSWGGIQPPWVYSLLALHLLGRPLDDPVMQAGLKGLDGFTIVEQTPDGPVRRLEACQSPVWDTALAVIALTDAGVPAAHPALVQAADWMVAEEVTARADWAVRRPRLAPGGWAFEFENDNYPDTDDTAEVVMALRRAAGGERSEAAVARAVAWTVGMQCRDGGWASFDADNTSELVTALPFCDFGAVTDPPSADVTAHIVEMLAGEGRAYDPVTQRGVRWLTRHQESDGSWFGRWGANYVYGTGAVVPALIAAGMSAGAPPITRAVHWLAQHQNADGGWGEDLRSYRDPLSWSGRGASTPSQTAWALLALLAAGERSTPTARGIAYLVDTQRPDGTWDEPFATGTGFPGHFYINYHLYRLVFPLMALGRYLGGPP